MKNIQIQVKSTKKSTQNQIEIGRLTIDDIANDKITRVENYRR